MPNLSLDQLFDPSKFKSLKQSFLKNDMQYHVNTDASQIDDSIDTISFYKEVVIKSIPSIDEFEFSTTIYETEVELCELNFYDDYLYPEIKNIVTNYKTKFENHLVNNHIWGDDDRENFGLFQMKRIDALKAKLQSLQHLTPIVKRNVDDVLTEIYFFLSSQYKIPRNNKDKIRLNASRIDVVLFFYLLQESGLINNTSLELSDFITRNFMYYDKSQNIFKEITGTKGLVRKIKSGESLNKSLGHLEAIFKSTNFYSRV